MNPEHMCKRCLKSVCASCGSKKKKVIKTILKQIK